MPYAPTKMEATGIQFIILTFLMGFNVMKICYNKYYFVAWMISLCSYFTVLIDSIAIYCCHHLVPL
jgi:hypothetical protein